MDGYIWDMFGEYKLAMHVFAFSLGFKSAAKNNNQNKIPILSDIFRKIPIPDTWKQNR